MAHCLDSRSCPVPDLEEEPLMATTKTPIKIDGTVFIFIIALGFVLVNSKWAKQELELMVNIISDGIKEMQKPQ